ncbi:MAG: hypothetical protein AAGF95_10165 [Chloroflexota bacterium]
MFKKHVVSKLKLLIGLLLLTLITPFASPVSITQAQEFNPWPDERIYDVTINITDGPAAGQQQTGTLDITFDYVGVYVGIDGTYTTDEGEQTKIIGLMFSADSQIWFNLKNFVSGNETRQLDIFGNYQVTDGVFSGSVDLFEGTSDNTGTFLAVPVDTQ